MACLCAEERKAVSYKLKKGELEAPDTPPGSPGRELGEEPGSQDDSEDPVRQDASEGDSEAEQAPDATNGKTGTQVSCLPWRGQASIGDAATRTSNWFQQKALMLHCHTDAALACRAQPGRRAPGLVRSRRKAWAGRMQSAAGARQQRSSPPRPPSAPRWSPHRPASARCGWFVIRT